ncbi:inorganic diphosphatase [Hanstruepera ponticola]|uniref:inorganic diphosphatase n=1 Tax=Hanstruepera ponticola TaxID=2042995 RepID=UPI00177F0F92|nr:inorganic diphosphatase [Hanstruepera ponticola]
MLVKSSILLIFIFTIISCTEKVNYYNLPTFSNDGVLNAVIEIPAGTNKKYEFHKEENTFKIDKENGQDRIINFLPYLGNYGFIPATFSDPNKGGDGDAIDVLVLSESVKTGSVMEIIPISVLKLIDDGELDYKIIAIPKNIDQQIINANSYKDLKEYYPEIQQIIEMWFLNYNKNDETQIHGWGNEQEALKEINNNLKI